MAQQKVFHGTRNPFVTLPGALEVRLTAVHEAVAVVLKPPAGVEDSRNSQLHPLRYLRVGHLDVSGGLFCAVSKVIDASQVHGRQHTVHVDLQLWL